MRPRLLIASGLGIGSLPRAAGTVASAVAVVIHAVLFRAGGSSLAAAGFAVFTLLGFWAAGSAARSLGKPDPAGVVIDEFAGQTAALLLLPPVPGLLIAGFLLFRLFDVLKPYPARRLEALPGSSGIMADDLIAGLYANLLLQAALRWGPVR